MSGGGLIVPRGQTTLDFLIGVSIFLLVVSVAFTTVPGILDPFSGSRAASPIVADSAANQLAREELAKANEPYVLDSDEVEDFFGQTESQVKDDLALGSTVSVRVKLVSPSTTRTVGDTPPTESNSVYAAWRVVTIGGEQANLRVEVW